MSRRTWMRHESAVDVHASLDEVWHTLNDVRRWPDWSESMTAVRPVGPGPLRVGSRIRIKQPGMPWATWRITRYEPRARFDWETRVIGVRMAATHELAETGDGRVSLVLGIEQRGPLVRLLGRRIATTAEHYLAMESAGLKAASEARHQAGSDHRTG
jgi:Polyketide cyclase / dehydrase and lipid transport